MGITDHLSLRLRWNGRTGLARSHDVVMTLVAPPVLPFAFVEVDFAPGACTLVRRGPAEKLDDMRPDEIAACRAYLAALDGPPDMEGDA